MNGRLGRVTVHEGQLLTQAAGVTDGAQRI